MLQVLPGIKWYFKVDAGREGAEMLLAKLFQYCSQLRMNQQWQKQKKKMSHKDISIKVGIVTKK